MENNKSNYPLSVKIAGVGRYLPRRVVTSSELEEACGLEKGWCEIKQGIRERHWVSKDETQSYMAAEAAREAADEAGMDIAGIDLIISATSSPEHLVPDGSAFIQRQLGLGDSGVSCFSLHTTCMSFVTGLDVGACLVALGRYKNALVVSSEICSLSVKKENISTYTLLGDGAGAAIITSTPQGEKSCFHSALHRTYGSGAYHAHVPLGTSKYIENRDICFDDWLLHMDGEMILRTGATYIPAFMMQLLSDSGVELDSLKLFVTHQPSKLALDRLRLSLSEKRIIRVIDHIGNCASACIPLALYEAVKTKRIERGDKIMITGPAGAGMNLSGIVLTY
jgi:3-oxoacyl-[acyl-carrier-protein] synthase III